MRGHRAALIGLLLAPSGCATLFSSTSSEFQVPEPEALEERLLGEAPRPVGKKDHFAILIGANTELRHRGNLSMAYQVLLEQGYQRENVYILDSEGQTPFFPFTELTTRAAVDLLFDHLAKVVEPEDTLLVYVTGHGRRITAEEEENGDKKTLGVSTLVLNPSEEMSQDEFIAELEKVRPEVGIVFFDQCYWGQTQSKKLCNYVTITTAEADETSHGVSFPRAFWSAFRRRPGSETTVLEAFTHAMVTDKATRLGFNRPRIAYGCVDPSKLLLLGQRRDPGPGLPSDTTQVSSFGNNGESSGTRP
ncbi:MAG: caspase family protein [Deltaproteobacteria bacterium]|nr:caspase family protein [Deltaproteobacteria bacterium]